MIPPRRAAQLSAHETSDFRAAVAAVVATTAIATGIVAATAAPTGTASIKTVAGSVTTTAVFPAAGPGAIAAAFAAGAGVATATATTAVATAAAAALATAAGTATAATTTAAGLSLVDAEGAPHQLSTLQPVDGLGFQFGIGHLHEGETTLATRIPLEGKGTVDHFAIGGEEFDHVFLLSAEGKIADEDAHGTSRGDRRAQMRQ